MKFTMKIEGGAQLAAKLNDLSTRMRKKQMREALEVAGEPIRVSMAQLAPREPGAPDLADHMTISSARVEGLIDNDMTAAIAIGPERDFYYGLFQEEGTAFHAAQPFARPAFDSNTGGALSTLIRELWSRLT